MAMGVNLPIRHRRHSRVVVLLDLAKCCSALERHWRHRWYSIVEAEYA